MATIDPQLADMLNQSVTWYAESASTVGTYGDPTWGSGTTITARVVWTMSLVKNADGEEVASDCKVLTASAIGLRDRLLLPGETVARMPAAIGRATDEDGTVPYRVIYL